MAKATKQPASSKTAIQSASDAPSATGPTGAIEMLKQDHRKVEGLFEKFEQSNDDEEKQQTARRICSELIIHMRLEEDIFYRSCRDAGVEEDAMDEAQVEHDSAKVLVNDLLEAEAGTAFFAAKVSVLKELIRHHVEEEEKPVDGTFAQAQRHGIDDNAIGQQLKQRKQELQGRSAGKQPIRAISLHEYQEDRMPRSRERDEYGRFMSDDDDRDYGRRRSRYEDDDYRSSRRGHGGNFGDPEEHARAARARWAERGSLHEDDDYENRGSSRSRYDEDDDYRGGGRGWYGDPEGHSRAARERWDENGGRGGHRRSREDEDDDDRRGTGGRRGHGGWFGDSEGHAEAARHRSGRGSSRYDDEDDRRGRSGGRSQGGWFGDPRGHAEASREGWRHRR